MNRTLIAAISWMIVIWICYVFLASLPYKFTLHPDTQHIFGTIGAWMQNVLGDGIGIAFANYGSYLVGSFELVTSVMLLWPALGWLAQKLGIGAGVDRAKFHRRGGIMASAVMAGAVFFHLFTPLGIEVLHQGESDGGSLFYAAVSILVLGFILFFINSSRSVADA